MVLIACTDVEHAGHVKRAASDMEWFPKLLTDHSVEARFGTSTSTPETADGPSGAQSWKSAKCVLQVPADCRTLCGIPIHLNVAGRAKTCTLGGPIVIGNVLHALTARHAFDSDDDTFDSNEPLFDIQVQNCLTLAAITYPNKYQGYDLSSETDLDYALLEISTLPSDILERVIEPVALDGSSISQFLENRDQVTGSVIINALGQNPLRGILTPMRQSIRAGNSTYSAQLIELKDVANQGLSGSWVTSRGYLCGHIVAARSDIPWAYMIPIMDVINDIRHRTGKRVKIPEKSDIECMILPLGNDNLDLRPRREQNDELPSRLTYTPQSFLKFMTHESDDEQRFSPLSSQSLVVAGRETTSIAKVNNVCHGDIRPQNILCFPDSEPFPTLKLSDFGSARIQHLKP